MEQLESGLGELRKRWGEVSSGKDSIDWFGLLTTHHHYLH